MTIPATLDQALPDQKPKHDPSSKTAQILRVLQRNGRATNFELMRITPRAAARVYDLTQEGYLIRSVHDKGARWIYIYDGHRDDEVQP